MLKIIAMLCKYNDAEQLCILIYTAVCVCVCVCMYIFIYVISYKTN